MVATWDDIRRITLDLPETSERTNEGVLQWRVKEKPLIWERPLRRADYEALGRGGSRRTDRRSLGR